jgi:hypothetical protein
MIRVYMLHANMKRGKNMNKTKNKTKKNEATAIPNGLTKTKTITDDLHALGTTLGITRDEINNTLQKKWVQTSAMILIATIVAAFSFVAFSKPAYYWSISSKDFDTMGQLMYNVFGRLR